jgi:hypothetical protein
MHQHGELKLLEWSDGEHRFGVSGTHSAASLHARCKFATGSSTESGPSVPRLIARLRNNFRTHSVDSA